MKAKLQCTEHHHALTVCSPLLGILMNYPCSCGHHYTRDQLPGNFDFEICPICFWEDDPVQNIHPNSKSGANAISLAEAQDNYQ